MAARLKRRSSIGFGGPGGRRESGGAPEPHTPTPFTQSTEDEEAAERRARNLQRKQAQNLETGQDSPGLERQGSSGRRSIGGISGLSAAQLAEHYNNCIKLSAENKISAKNAFNLQLIDYMATMIKKKESDMNNFQVAAGTLDASTKIYAYRVDSVYGDTLKIASGLGQAGKQDDGAGGEGGGDGAEDGPGVDDGDPNNPDQPKKKRRLKKSSTVEKNLKNINVSKFELEFDVDPLFKKTSSQFDGGAGGNQFLATLSVRDDSCELLLDSDTVMETVNTGMTPQKDVVGSGFSEVPGLEAGMDNLVVCTTFNNFSFSKWSLDREGQEDDEYNRLNESISASQEERSAGNVTGMETEENAFDAFAVPEPIDDLGDGMVDHDAGVDDMDRSEWSERAVGHSAEGGTRPGFTAALPMTTADMLSVLTTAPLEYSYFDHGKLGAWAGPKHWKFKPMSKVVQEGEKQKGRKRKEVVQLDYDMYDRNAEDNEELQEVLEKLSLLLTVPKKSVKLVDKTMKGWNRERSTLPEDLHYSGHELVRLKTVDKMVVQAVKKVPEAEVDDVEDYDYDNAADNDGYCPDIDDEQDAYGDAMEDPQQTILGSSMMEGDQEVPSSQVADFAGENLVEAPKMVDKAALQIGYAKTAKKVDMKRIKRVAWNILTQASSEEKENQSGSPEKQVDKELVEHNAGGREVEETQFTTLYKTLKQPTRLPKTMSENLSVPLAFIALLHLCNEESLHLIPSEQMDDFQIVQGKGWCN